GIAAAEDAGFSPVKLNCVVRRGVNDDGIDALVDFARHRGHTLRFIEYMDVGGSNGWRSEDVVPAAEVIERIAQRHQLQAAPPSRRGEVARRLRFREGGGEIGVITSVSQPFCADCTRIRMSADGQMYTCLFATRGHDLAAPLRAGAGADELAVLIRRLWTSRDDRYSELRSQQRTGAPRVEMSYIGG
ncbi:MAG TPA: GTP 3',8-cyclase MoaA, partial [Dehalococcoidia bacterium]|nr:GTP 3',8-cyclase MoaA [Dehalococcoidia bacterium]